MTSDDELTDYFRALIEAAPDGIIVIDHDGKIELVNAATEQIFGYPRDELYGQPIEALLPQRFHDNHREHLARFIASPRRRPMGSGLDLFGRRRDGSEFPLEISLSPIATATAHGTVIAAAIRDVTERKRIESEARRATSYLVSAVESIEDAFAVYDEDDRVVLVNSTFRELFGHAVEGPIVGRHFEELLTAIIAAHEFRIDGQGADQLHELWLRYHRDPIGSLELHTTGRTLRVVERRTAERGTVALFVDITEERAQADELRKARTLAEAASEAKSEFLASMSHELRTPLNAVLGFAQLLQRDKKEPLTVRQRERIDHVVNGGEHLLHLIDEVLDLARIEAGGLMISPEPLEVADVLGSVVETLQPLAQRASIELTATLRSASVIADRTRLAQILINFGSNAIKYNRAHGHVRFTIERAARESHLRIACSDDGIGIPAEHHARIFEPFHRAGQETGPIQGTGIGLTICRRLAERMTAVVGFTSELGRGSTFWVDVPRAEPIQTTSARHPTPPAGSPLRHQPRHLVVYIEDNPSNQAFMQAVLAELPGVELVTAATAELGLEIIHARRPSVIIMDINLPGMSGIDATKLLKQAPATAAIPVVALSAAALGRDTMRAEDAGFFRYLTKPVDVDELLAVLGELIAAEPASRGPM